MGWETQDVDRKVLAILKVLSDSPKSMGSKVIARRLKEQGVELSERTIRYHLNSMDERGLTHLIGPREGRILTEQGFKEVKSALVNDKVGFAISKIELLAFRTTFNPQDRTGYIPVNISLFAKEDFGKAVKIMKPVFTRGLCVSRLVSVVSEGEKIGDLVIPEGKVGLATVCSIIVNGTLLKAGVPINSKFGGLLQLRNHQPLRFVELIHYDGSSIDPSEVFIKAGMTSVIDSVKNGEGTILANYREIPAMCRTITEEVITRLKEIDIGGVLLVGNTSESVCQVPIELNRIGIILVGGLNPVAAAKEAGIFSENHAMSTLVEYKDLTLFDNL
jgi:HTH-type transcriptional regulator, global nitrogen regulator NrpRI